MATSVARLTFASTTPSVLRRNRSILLLHEAQVIPTTGNETSTGGAADGGACGVGVVGTLALILPRSITERRLVEAGGSSGSTPNGPPGP